MKTANLKKSNSFMKPIKNISGNFAYELHKKLTLHKETDLVDISTDIDTLIEIADKACDEYSDLEKENSDLEDERNSAESELEDMEDSMEEMEDAGACKNWGLLGTQIKEAFEACMTSSKVNQIKFLEYLEDAAQYGIV